MRIGFTINLGNYQSLRVDSSDLPNSKMCLDEIIQALQKLTMFEEVKAFLDLLVLEAKPVSYTHLTLPTKA